MQHQATGQSGQKTLIIALLGALAVAAIWYAISMSIMTTLVFGLPIGGIGALIVYRTIVRISQEKSPPPTHGIRAPANGKQPEDEPGDVKPTTSMKLK
jgi:hypothetical protein